MEQKRILVVDDEHDLCDILLFNLRAAGYQAEAVYSAEEALLRGVTDFDLLLLDVMMTGMSGFELAERLKAEEQTRHIPIIFLTAKDTEDDTLHGFSVGADDYVSKPFSVREVMARVKAVLGRSIMQPLGQVFNRQQLLDRVWPQDVIVTERTVDVNIARLRKKLGCYAACLVSRTGFGYCFKIED